MAYLYTLHAARGDIDTLRRYCSTLESLLGSYGSRWCLERNMFS